MFNFEDKAVLITGGSQGIGLAIARAFEEAKAKVHITGTRDGVEEYEWNLGGLIYHKMLADSEEDRSRLAREIDQLDVLVNNVGGGHPDEYDTSVFNDVIQKNLVAVMDLCTRFKPKLQERGGNIVNVGSVSSFTAQKERPAYSAAKTGLLGLTRALGDQWALDGVRVNMVAPGFVRTRLTNRMRVEPALEKRLIASVPMKRWAEPEEIAGPVLFLASRGASYVTGTSLVADGGLLIR